MSPSRALLAGLALLSACRQKMDLQGKIVPLAPSGFFADGRQSRPLPLGVVPREEPSTGRPQTTPALLARGRERFDIYCAVCHGRTGDGDGIVVRRGFPTPTSYHTEYLRRVPDRHLYDVIANGFGVMYPYGDRVEPADRWAIVAYIRALQLSRNARLSDAPPDARRRLEAAR